MMKHESPAELTKTNQEWRKELTPQQYEILREGGTERPGTGALLHNSESGMYTCGACGADLFTSDSKFDSHCGWPGFTQPGELENVRLLDDGSMGMRRTEVRCKTCDSHLGHVFDDGPGPAGTRYCINSLSLDFKKK